MPGYQREGSKQHKLEKLQCPERVVYREALRAVKPLGEHRREDEAADVAGGNYSAKLRVRTAARLKHHSAEAERYAEAHPVSGLYERVFYV